MSHPIYSVTTVEILEPYTLRVGFDDSTSQVIDFGPVLEGELLGPLRDLGLFEQTDPAENHSDTERLLEVAAPELLIRTSLEDTTAQGGSPVQFLLPHCWDRPRQKTRKSPKTRRRRSRRSQMHD